MTNNTISENSASGGGGIYTFSGTNTMTNNTISGNSAGSDGGGIYTLFGTNTMTNSIIWGNSSGIVNDKSVLTVTYSIVQGGFTGIGNKDMDPIFVNAADPDGPDNIHRTADDGLRLQSSSPAINMGDNAAIPLEITTDITGGPRILQGTVDLGAYEKLGCPSAATNTLYVNASNMSPVDGSTWGNAFNKLQDALTFACGCTTTKFDILVAKGTYYPDEGVGRTDNNRDEAFILCDGIKLYGGFAGGETMLSLRNISGNPTILSGDIDENNTLDNGNAYHVVVAAFASTTPTTRLDGFTITGGNANGGSGPFIINGQNIPRDNGGGIRTFEGTNTITNNTISGNSADRFGGGINTYRGDNTMTNNTISGNSAGDIGGGINTYQGTNIMTNNTVSGNTAKGGGGISTAEGTNTMTNNTVFGNTATSSNGGGIFTSDGTNTLTNNTISGNIATSSNGGGIFVNRGTNTMTNNTISSNSAAQGGGIWTNSGTNTLTNNNISGNTASLNGGGIFFDGGGGINTMTNTTISGNMASQGGGIFTASSNNTLTNSIIWGNSSSIFNNVSNPSTNIVTYSIVQGGHVGIGNKDMNPLFINASDIDGPDNVHRTGDDGLRLQPGSPAINMGNNAAIAGITTDITGGPRILQGTVDMGAYENLGCPSAATDTLYVNASNMSPVDGSIWDNAFNKLQDALALACGCPNTDFDIWVAKGTYYPDEGVGRTDNNRDETFALCDGIKLYGGFAGGETMLSLRNISGNPTILSGDIDINNTLDDFNAYHVVVAAFAFTTTPPTTRLDGFTITGGNANESGHVIINGQSIFRNNGGGIYNRFGTSTITNNTISGNTASLDGGGIYTSFCFNTMTNNTITGNSTVNDGGGIHTSQGTNTITNNTVSGNTASDSGGGINTFEGTNTITNNTISGNLGNRFGGGINT